jgi:hypothetical protein
MFIFFIFHLSSYNKVKVEALPGLKKGSSLVEAEDGLGGVVKMDRTYHR